MHGYKRIQENFKSLNKIKNPKTFAFGSKSINYEIQDSRTQLNIVK